MRDDDKKQLSNALSIAGSLGFNMVATLVVGVFLGQWTDATFNTYPWATIAGIVLGMVAGLWSVYKRVMNQ